MKKNRRDESIGVVIHIDMEYPKKTHYVANFISNKQKCHFLLFSSTQSEECGTGPVGEGRLVTAGEGKGGGG
jgi:hypothetical protein